MEYYFEVIYNEDFQGTSLGRNVKKVACASISMCLP